VGLVCHGWVVLPCLLDTDSIEQGVVPFGWGEEPPRRVDGWSIVCLDLARRLRTDEPVDSHRSRGFSRAFLARADVCLRWEACVEQWQRATPGMQINSVQMICRLVILSVVSWSTTMRYVMTMRMTATKCMGWPVMYGPILWLSLERGVVNGVAVAQIGAVILAWAMSMRRWRL
jgi:hypothetical protein